MAGMRPSGLADEPPGERMEPIPGWPGVGREALWSGFNELLTPPSSTERL